MPEPSARRAALRDALTIGFILFTAPAWSVVRLLKHLCGSDAAFVAWSDFLSLFPGKFGIFLRRAFYIRTLEECAWDCSIAFGTTFSHDRVRIGRGVVVGKNCLLGCCILEDGVALGSNVDLLSGRRQHIVQEPSQPIQFTAGQYVRIRIGANAWIGNSTVIMADVGSGSIVGAGSVVVQAVPPATTVVGNPARVIRRDERGVEALTSAQGGTALCMLG